MFGVGDRAANVRLHPVPPRLPRAVVRPRRLRAPPKLVRCAGLHRLRTSLGRGYKYPSQQHIPGLTTSRHKPWPGALVSAPGSLYSGLRLFFTENPAPNLAKAFRQRPACTGRVRNLREGFPLYPARGPPGPPIFRVRSCSRGGAFAAPSSTNEYI